MADFDKSDAPTPGSDEALAQGCTCPVVENDRGRGSYRADFVIDLDCPIHGENLGIDQ